MKEIRLTQGLVAYVDDVDFSVLTKFPWYADRNESTIYAATHVGRRKTYMHRLLVQPAVGLVVDHIDCNGLNNQRSNLRAVTKAQNTVRRAPLSGVYKGVTQKRPGQWFARLIIDDEQLYLGTFRSPEEAALAYDAAAVKYFGEFAWLNSKHGVLKG